MELKYKLEPREYYIDPINAQDNERIIELRLGINWYKKIIEAGRKNNIIEIGNVLGWYGYPEHRCIDKFAEDPDISAAGEVEKIDALDEDLTDKDVICISTIEHLGLSDYDNPNPNDGEDAITLLDKIVAEAKSYFITFGPNHNKRLDEYIKSHLVDFERSWEWHGWCRKDVGEWDYVAQDMKVWEMKKDTPFPSENGLILLKK